MLECTSHVRKYGRKAEFETKHHSVKFLSLSVITNLCYSKSTAFCLSTECLDKSTILWIKKLVEIYASRNSFILNFVHSSLQQTFKTNTMHIRNGPLKPHLQQKHASWRFHPPWTRCRYSHVQTNVLREIRL